MTRLEIAARILVAMQSRPTVDGRWDGVPTKQDENPTQARLDYCLRQADGLIARELETRPEPEPYDPDEATGK